MFILFIIQSWILGHKMFFADRKLSENRNDTKTLENLKSMELTKNISNKELDTSMDSALTEKNSADISWP